jgi:uncharacterized membrane protein YphA (DoxX/SURF4 family)
MTALALPHISAAPVARHLLTAARISLGFLFLVSGLDGFFHFLPVPASPMPEGAMAFAGGLLKSGYMFPLIKGTELLCGALLLWGRLVALALVLLAPVLVNIVAFHAFLAPSGLPLAVVLLVLELTLAWSRRQVYLPLLSPERAR